MHVLEHVARDDEREGVVGEAVEAARGIDHVAHVEQPVDLVEGVGRPDDTQRLTGALKPGRVGHHGVVEHLLELCEVRREGVPETVVDDVEERDLDVLEETQDHAFPVHPAGPNSRARAPGRSDACLSQSASRTFARST